MRWRSVRTNMSSTEPLTCAYCGGEMGFRTVRRGEWEDEYRAHCEECGYIIVRESIQALIAAVKRRPENSLETMLVKYEIDLCVGDYEGKQEWIATYPRRGDIGYIGATPTEAVRNALEETE